MPAKTEKPKKTPGPGHNSNISFAKARLRSYFERVEALNEEIDTLNSDKSEVYSEAKAEGFDTKIMRIVLSRRKMERAEVEERDSLIDLYEQALSGMKPATRARAREDTGGEDA